MITQHSRVWVEIDLGSIAHNVAVLREKVGANVLLMPLIKANAYRCGAAEVGKVALASGANWLGVELIEEALPLRDAKIQAPILVVGPSSWQEAGIILANQLRVTVRDLHTISALEAEGCTWDRKVPVHVELETGLNRLGVREEQALALIHYIRECQFVQLEGVWTHFAESDADDPGFTRQQFHRYLDFIKALNYQGITVPVKHVANSAALLKFPQMHLDLVRFGESVYGYLPDMRLFELANLRPVVTWKSRLIQKRSISPGESVGYGRNWITNRPSVIGTIPVGYADGYRRSLANRASVLVRGNRAPLVGRVSMHMVVVDLTDISNAEVGDEVILLGEQEQVKISAYELAAWAQTTEFEILVGISVDIPRHYR